MRNRNRNFFMKVAGRSAWPRLISAETCGTFSVPATKLRRCYRICGAILHDRVSQLLLPALGGLRGIFQRDQLAVFESFEHHQILIVAFPDLNGTREELLPLLHVSRRLAVQHE